MHVNGYRGFFFMILLHWLPTAALAQPEERAIQIADSVIGAMGGKLSWEQVHYVQWTFFGRRTLTWDKWTGDVRIEIPARKQILLSNIHTKRGTAYRDGVEISADSNAWYMDRAYRILVNDSYWLAMPFKLRDPGVSLSYLGADFDSAMNSCFILQLTFDRVGVTPQNKYHIWVNRKTYLVSQWAYFENRDDLQPVIINRWGDYRWYSRVLLSGDRGSEGQLSGISLPEKVPVDYFLNP